MKNVGSKNVLFLCSIVNYLDMFVTTKGIVSCFCMACTNKLSKSDNKIGRSHAPKKNKSGFIGIFH